MWRKLDFSAFSVKGIKSIKFGFMFSCCRWNWWNLQKIQGKQKRASPQCCHWYCMRVHWYKSGWNSVRFTFFVLSVFLFQMLQWEVTWLATFDEGDVTKIIQIIMIYFKASALLCLNWSVQDMLHMNFCKIFCVIKLRSKSNPESGLDKWIGCHRFINLNKFGGKP